MDSFDQGRAAKLAGVTEEDGAMRWREGWHAADREINMTPGDIAEARNWAVDGFWTCSSCGADNTDEDTACQSCRTTFRQKEVTAPPPNASGKCPKCGHPNHKSRMHQDICTVYVPAMGAECGCSHPQEPATAPREKCATCGGSGVERSGACHCGESMDSIGFAAHSNHSPVEMTRPCPDCKKPDPRDEQIAELRRELEREEAAHAATIRDRDAAAEAADTLALTIGTPEEIGEHSNMNDPWANAADLLVDKLAAITASRDRAQRERDRMANCIDNAARELAAGELRTTVEAALRAALTRKESDE